jgi:hypothetical protein
LYENSRDITQLILLVTVIIRFDFWDGSEGTWTDAEKDAFAVAIQRECAKAWTDKWTIRTEDSAAPTNDAKSTADAARVAISIETLESDIWNKFSHNHWNIRVYKGPSPLGVYVSRSLTGAGWDGCWDNQGLKLSVPEPAAKAGINTPRQRTVHEFGHLLGLPDEYRNSDKGTDLYLGDTDSLMNWGSTIRSRHYVFFADWISRHLNTKFPNQCKPNGWKVDGKDTTNTRFTPKAKG